MSLRRSGVVLLVACLPIGSATAQETEQWTGPWLAAGDAEWKYVDGSEPHVSLRAVFPELGHVQLSGQTSAGAMVLEGTAEKRPRTIRGQGHPEVRLEARPSQRSQGELDVRVTVDGTPFSRTRWHRPSEAGVSVARQSVSYLPNDRRPLKLEVVVVGRPQPLRIKILRQDGYSHLAGLVHYDETETLAVGRHTILWSGRDRSAYRKVAVAGSYTVVVESAESPLGPPPTVKGHEPGAPVPFAKLALKILPARAQKGRKRERPVVLVPDWPELTDPKAKWPVAGDPPGPTKGIAGALNK